MKASVFKAYLKEAVRDVVREEIDFYFTKLQKQISEMTVSGKDFIEAVERTSPQKKEKEPEDFGFRKKYAGFLGQISEGINTEDPEISHVKSILDENLEANPKTSAISSIFKRDYSGFVKAMDKRKK